MWNVPVPVHVSCFMWNVHVHVSCFMSNAHVQSHAPRARTPSCRRAVHIELRQLRDDEHAPIVYGPNGVPVAATGTGGSEKRAPDRKSVV